MGRKLNENERNEWLKNKFLKLAEKKGWEGPYFHVAEQAFFEGVGVKGLNAAKMILGEKYDRRIKVTKKDRRNIVAEYAGGESMKSLASRYGVSVTLIYLILHPDSYERVKKRAAEWHKANVKYDKESYKETYLYKKRLAIKGVI